MQRAFGLNIPQTLEEVCDRTRLALIVYDMQVGIVNQIKNGHQITGIVVKVLTSAREAGIRVFFTRHMSLPKELMGVSQLRMAMAWQRVESVEDVKPWFLRESPGFHLVPELNPLPSEAIFDKLAMSAFEGTPLDFALRDCGIDAFLARSAPKLLNVFHANRRDPFAIVNPVRQGSSLFGLTLELFFGSTGNEPVQTKIADLIHGPSPCPNATPERKDVEKEPFQCHNCCTRQWRNFARLPFAFFDLNE